MAVVARLAGPAEAMVAGSVAGEASAAQSMTFGAALKGSATKLSIARLTLRSLVWAGHLSSGVVHWSPWSRSAGAVGVEMEHLGVDKVGRIVGHAVRKVHWHWSQRS